MTKPRRVTPDEIKIILDHYRRGFSIEKIRRKFHIGVATARAIVNYPERSMSRAVAGRALTAGPITRTPDQDDAPEPDEKPIGVVKMAPPLPKDRVPIDLAARAARVQEATDSRRVGPAYPHSVAVSSSPAGQCADAGVKDHRGRPW